LEARLPAALAAPTADGRIVVHFGAEQVDIGLHHLLPMGARLEVLEPLELRQALAATARAMAQRYSVAV